MIVLRGSDGGGDGGDGCPLSCDGWKAGCFLLSRFYLLFALYSFVVDVVVVVAVVVVVVVYVSLYISRLMTPYLIIRAFLSPKPMIPLVGCGPARASSIHFQLWGHSDQDHMYKQLGLWSVDTSPSPDPPRTHDHKRTTTASTRPQRKDRHKQMIRSRKFPCQGIVGRVG